MKKIILPMLLLIFGLSSCLKERTCTCKDSSGTVISKTSTKTNSKSSIESFETNCIDKHTDTKVNGVVVSSIPCELS